MLTADQEFVRPSRPVADPRAAQRRSPAYIRWVQQSLNRILGTRMYVNGMMGPRVSNAVRAFQGRAGLPADGVVGPRTEAALIAAGAPVPPGRARQAAPGRPRPVRPAAPIGALIGLPSGGAGYYSYSASAQQYGHPATIRAIQAIGAAWQRAQPRGPRIGIGDLSIRGGGPMRGHASHQRGLDVDIRPLRADGRDAATTFKSPEYSRALTQQLVNMIRSNGVLRVRAILFNDPKVRGVKYWPGHDNHLHVRFELPGTGDDREADEEINRRSPEYMRWVQQSLNDVAGAGLAVDGIKGPRTTAAIRRYQQSRGLTADGIVGPNTEAALLRDGVPSPPGSTFGPPAPPFGPPAPPPSQPPAVPPAQPQPVPPQARICDSEGRRLLTGGIWNGNTTISVRGGQAMNFVIRNLNVLGTTISITDNFGQTQSRIIPPFGTINLLFTAFGCEPMGWSFRISTSSDAFLVGWQLCSTWVPGEPRNC
jgi:peptidoglycan hydrolase-like protein with peptidoglycan-binding domain